MHKTAIGTHYYVLFLISIHTFTLTFSQVHTSDKLEFMEALILLYDDSDLAFYLNCLGKLLIVSLSTVTMLF